MMMNIALSVLVLMAGVVTASAQSDVVALCRGTTGKALACCRQVVAANPKISQCAKERAVFKCAGGKSYTSTNGCGTFTQ